MKRLTRVLQGGLAMLILLGLPVSATQFTTYFTGGVFVAIGDLNGDGIGEVITGAGPGGTPDVRVLRADGTDAGIGLVAYSPLFTGGVRTASCDVNGDGKADIVTAPGPGGGPHVRVFDGANPAVELASFLAYTPTFTGGVWVACGRVDGDNRAEVITGADAGGGPHVRVFRIGPGSAVAELFGFFAYDPGFRGGVRVAACDLNGDGKADIVTAAGPGGGPHVRAFDGTDPSRELTGFMAYGAGFTGGVLVACGSLGGGAGSQIVTAADAGGGPHVRVFTGAGADTGISFFAYDPSFRGGVRVAVGALDASGLARIVTAPGPGGGPHVRGFTGIGTAVTPNAFAFVAPGTGAQTAETTPDGKPVCAAWVHARYVTPGVDGQLYTTWHPQVDPTYRCAIGHEHGSDPRLFLGAGYSGVPAFGHAAAAASQLDELAAHAGFKTFVVNDDHQGKAWMMVLHQGSGSPRRASIRFHSLEIWIVRRSDRALLAHVNLMADFGDFIANCDGHDGRFPERLIPTVGCDNSDESWYGHINVADYLRASPLFKLENPTTAFNPADPAGTYPNLPQECGGPDPFGWGSLCKGDWRSVFHPNFWVENFGPTDVFFTEPYGGLVPGPGPGIIQQFVLRGIAFDDGHAGGTFVMPDPSNGGLYRHQSELSEHRWGVRFEFPGAAIRWKN